MIQDDLELTSKDIQALANRDAIASLFAGLGYDTNERLEQNISAMGFTGDVLKTSIKYIERLASEDGGLLEVYLVELKSVTVSATHALARAFRNSSVQFPLLVLTDDYQRLDFVLVERYSGSTNVVQAPLAGFPLSTPRQISVRPRVLTVNRRQPGNVELRVLRRFSYTESDSFAQYDKLLSAYVVAEWSEPYFNNRALFSDYYLTKRLPESPEWRDKTNAVLMTRAFQEIRKLFEDARLTFANTPASIVQAELIAPALDILGFSTRQPPQSSPQVEPTYYLRAQSPSDAQSPLAHCLAYSWGRNLDSRDDQRDHEKPDENPGAVVVSLLDRGQADWAIVTNGKIWRLYSAKAHSRATNYYEIDLEETLVLPKDEREIAFRYFWYLFRAPSFQPADYKVEDETRQLCFLDTLVTGSERYALELGTRLKDRVFNEIFSHFARGFITHARQTGQFPADLEALSETERADLLSPYFEGTLTFLYRLLFLLYAESRDLLPVRETRGYFGKSIEKLKGEIAAQAGPIEDQAPELIKLSYSESRTIFYDRLQELFSSVDTGDTALNVPIYNGGFFVTQVDAADTSAEARAAHFLATHKIPDLQLALGLDRLVRDPDEKTKDLGFIDFKSLGVRQLGSIYEGLLEFKLRVALTDMAIIKGKKTEEVVPYAEALEKKLPIVKEGRGKNAVDKILPKGSIYLENDRRERKATGSYYTPDYIVKYIVENTVGPILQNKLEALRPVFREAEQTLRSKREKAAALKKMDIRADDPERETYARHKKELNEVFFDLKVLDPAMGSGHFLVEAVDYITDRMADFLSSFRWNPIVYELALTRLEIQEEMERQGVSIDMSRLTDLNLLKRHVLKSCIYGVDLNHMAVQLAKVSLWLDCFTLGAPLSFLDHHMKWGNSLIGGNVQEVQDALQGGLWGFHFTYLLDAAQLMRKVSGLSDVTAREIATSKSAYRGAYDALAPFKRLLNVWTSEYFDNKGAKRITQDCAGVIYDNTYEKAPSQKDREAIEKALKLAAKKRFFHWELEFPEVFFDETKRKENGGFDVVVGNPPYDELSEDARGSEIDEMAYLESSSYLKPALGHRINLYRLFIAQALCVVGKEKMHGFIVPLSILADQFTYNLREHLLLTTRIKLIEQFPQKDDPFDRVFFDAKLSTCIYIIQRSVPTPDDRINIRTHPGRNIQSDSDKYIAHQQGFFEFDRNNLSIPGLSQRAWDLVSRLSDRNKYMSLGDYAKALPGELMINRQFDPYLTNSLDGEEIIRGSHVSMYELVEPKQGETLYLNREKYLSSHTSSIKAFHHRYERVVYQRYAAIDNYRRLIATVLPRNLFCSHTVGYLADIKDVKLGFFVALLNSTLLDWRFNLTSTNNNINGYEVEALPFPKLNSLTSRGQHAHYLEIAKDLYQSWLEENNQNEAFDFVELHLSQQPGLSDIVHDFLAFLAEEMMRLNKERQIVQQEFLTWLENTLKILPDNEGQTGIDALSGKAKLVNYSSNYQKGEPALSPEELLDILRKNKNRLGVSLNGGSLVDMILVKYEKSLQRVLPIKETLRKTDALIDAVVYRLYGLTEEEIRVVEGKA